MGFFDAQGRRLKPLRNNWALPPWVYKGFIDDSIAEDCENIQDWPFLRRAVPPSVGQRLYCHVPYWHDGSHPEAYYGMARMVGHVTEVLPAAPRGWYATYAGQDGPGRWERAQLLAGLPCLRPANSQRCKGCGILHTEEEALQEYGAVHGQRVRGKLRLGPDDQGFLEPQWAGEWDVELIMDDGSAFCWCICRLEPAGPAGTRPLAEVYPPRPNAPMCGVEPMMGPGPDGLMLVARYHPVPPVLRTACPHCSMVGARRQDSQDDLPGGEGAAVVELRACPGCRSVFYCSRNCQRLDWPHHKPECKRLRQPQAEPAEA